MKWKESKREASINVTVIKGLVRDVTGGPMFRIRSQGMRRPSPFRVPGLRSQGMPPQVWPAHDGAMSFTKRLCGVIHTIGLSHFKLMHRGRQ